MSKSGVEILVSISFVRLDVAVAEVEEGLPADEPARRTRAAAKVDRVGLSFPGGVEDHREERVAVVSLQVRPVGGAHHAVPEAVGSRLELDRHEYLSQARPVEASLPQGVADSLLPDDQRHELVQESQW